ncbi:MAG: metal ABC transporter substrate-binding protein [Planctomycetota bacterium]|jgi:zinc transport system substrate-binding protein
MKRFNQYLSVCVVCLTVLMLASCSKKTEPQRSTETAGKLVVYTVNYPLQYFAERIGGDLVEARYPGPDDEDPAYWQPDADVIEAYQKADLILLNGADYAKWIKNVSLPASKTVNTSAVFQDYYIPLEEEMTHSHGPGGKHAHGGFAFTIWLDFVLAAQQANAIKEAMIKLLPEKKSEIQTNFTSFSAELLELDRQMKSIAAQMKDKPFIVSHPVYQYWTHAYGLNVQSVHWEPDESPSPEQVTELKEMLQSHPADWMVWEDEPIQESITKLKGMNIESVVFSPCSTQPEQGNFMTVMQTNISLLDTIF